LTLMRFTKPHGLLGGLMVAPKVLAGSLAPLWAFLGILGSLAALWRRDWLAAVTGLFAIGVSARHISQVTKSRDDLFTQAFGLNWQRSIPSSIQPRLLPRRWPPNLPDPKAGVRWQRNIVFGQWPSSGEPLLCDLWQPPKEVTPSGLGLIYIHGSAWHFCDKDFLTRPFFRHLAWQGHTIMDIAYTMAPKAELFGMVGDVKRAIGWLKANSNQLEVDSDHIVLMGGSAGGHLALLAAYTPNHSTFEPIELPTDTSVRAVVCYYGFSDMVDTYDYLKPESGLGSEQAYRWLNTIAIPFSSVMRRIRFLPEYANWTGPELWIPDIMGGSPEELPEKYQLASPLSHVSPDCPPTLFIQGAHDFGGMVRQIKHLNRALRDAGVLSVYFELPDTDHGFDLILPQVSPAAQTATFYTERFLAMMI
jgi:acetyl esterase/lipase